MDARLLAAACALTLVPALGGCLQDVGTQSIGPVADLQATPREAWAGEPVTLDGRGSGASGGDAIVLWRFDFGDGSQAEVRSHDEAVLEHAYDEPGRYVVTLTVETEEGAGREAASDSVTLGVGERIQVAGVVAEDPAGLGSADNASVSFEAGDDSTAFAVDLDVNGSALDESKVRVEVLDPAGTVLDDATATIGPGDSERIALDGLLGRSGRHEVRVSALQGSAQVHGEVQVLYAPRA